MPAAGNRIRSQKDHNKSMLPSNRPKFKENIRENIYKDEIPKDGIFFENISEETLNEIIKNIRYKARCEAFKQIKLVVLSILVTLLITFLFINEVEKEIKHRRMESSFSLTEVEMK